jgi:hypothetical protein
MNKKAHATLFTIDEICKLYQVSPSNIRYLCKKNKFEKKVFNGQRKYLLSQQQIDTILRIPSVSDSVIYCHTVWEILPSKLNFLTLKQLQIQSN